jgi:hypothetical protein
LRSLGLFHQFEFFVFDLRDGRFAGFDFVADGFKFFVLLRFKLLDRILGNFLFLRFDFQLKVFLLRLDLFSAQLGGVEAGLGVGGARF